MNIDIPLSRFAKYLTDAGQLDEENPHLHQQTWLSENFSFDDDFVHYEPARMPWPTPRVNVAEWFWRISKN